MEILETVFDVKTQKETTRNIEINFLESELKQKELMCLIDWFNNFFEKQLIQSLWQIDFKVSKDIYFKDENGEFLTYKDVNELKNKGEEVRKRIKELKNI